MEKSKYGWFWQCPTGENCIYRHALPPGFVLKKDKKKEEKKNDISLEDLIERERAALGGNQTRITLETFIAWKKRKIQVIFLLDGLGVFPLVPSSVISSVFYLYEKSKLAI